jgi:energy-dependent translational throttle protein EttA
VGINGSGKSTFMKIIAGEDDDYDGEINIPSTYKVGYLHQEPELDHDKNVRDNVLEGIEDKLEMLDEYEQVRAFSHFYIDIILYF